MSTSEVRIQLFGCFSDDFKCTLQRVLLLQVLFKFLERYSINELLSSTHSIQDILEILSLATFWHVICELFRKGGASAKILHFASDVICGGSVFEG